MYNYAPGGSGKKGKESKRKKIPVKVYVKSLIEMWSKAFGSENIMKRKAVAHKIRNGLAWNFNQVYNRKSQLTKREQVKLWRQLPKVKRLLDILKKTSKPELFREDEKNFYWEKKTITRIGYLKEQIDIDFEKMEENIQTKNQFRNKEDKELAQPCEDINLEVSNSGILNFTFKSTSSSVVRFEEENLPQIVEWPPQKTICKTFTEEVKAACASVSSKCSISAEKAMVFVKTVYKGIYQHQYTLNTEDYKDIEEMKQTNLEPPSKVPKTSKDYNALYKQGSN